MLGWTLKQAEDDNRDRCVIGQDDYQMQHKKKKSLNEHFLSVRTQMCLHAHIQTKTGCLAFLFSLASFCLCPTFIFHYEKAVHLSLSSLSLAHLLHASSLTFIEHSNECSDLPALCAQKLFVCVHRSLAL